MEAIGGFLRQLRKEKGLTQEQLGQALGVTGKTVSRWETGSCLPSVDLLQELSGYYGVTIQEIISARRLAPEEYRAVAEEGLKQALRENPFSLEERVAYYKKKWLREHIAVMVGMGLVIAALAVGGVLLRSPVMIGCCPLALVAAHALRHNAMMTYVERNAFDGTGS